MNDENNILIGIIYNLGINNNINTKLLPINTQNSKNLSNMVVQIESILDCFPFLPKIGLQKVGTASFMNAILQCFCNILHFVDFFKFNSKVEETINKYLKENKLCLTSSFKILIDNLWPYGNKILESYQGKNFNNIFFIPQEIENKISKMNNLFKGVAAYDPKDLVNFIIMTLHEELNETPKSNINNNGVNNQNINLYNNNEVLQNFLNNFKNENSIISKDFYAVYHTLSKCSKCQLIENNYQKYYFLIFPLEEIRKYKINQYNKQMMNMCQNMFNANPFLFQQNLQKIQNINSVTLEDCLNYKEKIDTFQGENAIYCNFCKAQLTSFYQTKLFTGPEILIIILDRVKEIEFKVKLEFGLFIDITNYIELKENNGWKYELIGIITYLAKNNESGHFIAFCKSPIDGSWYQYNDELVFEVKDFAKEIRDNTMPEILFYQKINK
jgi:ubiquitin C-terminal hydrolase